MRATMIPLTLVGPLVLLEPSLAQTTQPMPAQAAPAQAAPAQAASSQATPSQTAPVQPMSAQPVLAQPVPWHPCAKITAACRQAGFVPNGARMGLGIALDCIQPIMIGTPQRKQATKALPQIDPQVVQACKERSPNFGMDGGPIVAFSLRTR
jgi:hypothetical protein